MLGWLWRSWTPKSNGIQGGKQWVGCVLKILLIDRHDANMKDIKLLESRLPQNALSKIATRNWKRKWNMQKRQKFINSDCMPQKIPSIIRIILLRIQKSQKASHLLPRRFLQFWNDPKNIRRKTGTSEGATKKDAWDFLNEKHPPGSRALKFKLAPHGACSTAGAPFNGARLAAFSAGTTNSSAFRLSGARRLVVVGSGEVREDWNGCSLGRNEDWNKKTYCMFFVVYWQDWKDFKHL